MPAITLEDDITITTFRPPSGFDPLIATASELEQHGFPARPDNPLFLKLYQRIFGRLGGRFKYVEPTFRISRDKPHDPPNRTSPSGIFTGDNWSGAVVQPPPGQSFRQVLGHWVVPNAHAPTPNPFLNSYWIGLDGFVPGANEVLQAGVDCFLFGGLSSFYLWHQWAPSAKVSVTNPTVSAGDLVVVSISAAPGAGATNATVYFANSRNKAQKVIFVLPAKRITQS